jgi:head-tail adaptor
MALIGERLGAPVTAMLTVYPLAAVTAGNRIVVESRTYDIIGVDDSADDVWHAALTEVV